MDTTKVIRPLDEAGASIDKLEHYTSTAELTAALQATWQAVDRTLRNLVRADPGAPDEMRLGALSATDLPHDRLIPALRQRNLISLPLAGMIHELELAQRRAAEGGVRASDGDHAAEVVEQLRTEIGGIQDRPVMQAAHSTVESGVLEQPAHAVPASRTRHRALRLLPFLAAFVAIAVALLLVFGGGSDLEKGVAAFQGEQWQTAETHLLKAAEDGDNVAAQLYLARVYRSTKQFDRAAAVLRTAVAAHADDDDLQRELGKLFLDLKRPDQAVERLKRARDLDRADQANWIWLVRAMRLAADPEAEQVLQEAPDEVRAALTRSN